MVLDRYLYKFLSYRDPYGPWFPVHLAPDAVSWWIVDNNPKFTHCVYRNEKAIFWVIGTLVEVQLLVSSASERSHIHVTIDFLHEHDRMHALRLYNSVASGPYKLPNMRLLKSSSPRTRDEGLPVCHRVLYFV